MKVEESTNVVINDDIKALLEMLLDMQDDCTRMDILRSAGDNLSLDLVNLIVKGE